VGYVLDRASPSGDVDAVVLRFARGAWSIGVDSAWDTVTLTRLPGPGPEATDVSGRLPWSAAIGRRLQWVWVLSNQQGYADALQLEFRDCDVTVQLLAVASILRVRTVHPAG